MAVNRITAKIILEHIYRSFKFDEEAGRWQIKAKHITPMILADIQSDASNKGERVNMEDVEYIQYGLMEPMYSITDVQYPLIWNKILCGETFKFYYQDGGSMRSITVMKVSLTEVLIVDKTDKQYTNPYFVIDGNRNFHNGSSLPLQGYENFKINAIESISPGLFYYYLDDFMLEKRHKFTVADNIWDCYNKTKEFVEGTRTQDQFIWLLESFTMAGLSTFHLRIIIDALS